MDQIDVERMIRETLATLKYQELPELIGRSLHLSSAETAPEEVLAQCGQALPKSTKFYQPNQSDREKTIRRYGIVDLTYRIDPRELDHLEIPGEALAATLGLYQDIEAMIEYDGGWEAELWSDLAQGNAYVRLFLRTWEQLTPQEREHRRKYGVPPDFFISAYRIIDACLTNSHWVWFLKHFYG